MTFVSYVCLSRAPFPTWNQIPSLAAVNWQNKNRNEGYDKENIKKKICSIKTFYDWGGRDVIHLSQLLYLGLNCNHRFLIHQPQRVCIHSWGLSSMWFFLHLTPRKEWVSELIWVKDPEKTETRLVLNSINSLIWFVTLFHNEHSWGCGARGNGLVSGSQEAGNLSDSAVTKTPCFMVLSLSPGRSAILTAKIPFLSWHFYWNGWVSCSSCHRRHEWHMHVPVTLWSLELPLCTATA